MGSGPIGLEAGMALKRNGYHVVILELLSHVLPRVFDEHPAAIIKSLLEQRGIEVLERERLVEIMGKDSVSGITTDKRTITVRHRGPRNGNETARQLGRGKSRHRKAWRHPGK